MVTMSFGQASASQLSQPEVERKRLVVGEEIGGVALNRVRATIGIQPQLPPVPRNDEFCRVSR